MHGRIIQSFEVDATANALAGYFQLVVPRRQVLTTDALLPANVAEAIAYLREQGVVVEEMSHVE